MVWEKTVNAIESLPLIKSFNSAKFWKSKAFESMMFLAF
jgi:hypothetical protein